MSLSHSTYSTSTCCPAQPIIKVAELVLPTKKAEQPIIKVAEQIPVRQVQSKIIVASAFDEFDPISIEKPTSQTNNTNFDTRADKLIDLSSTKTTITDKSTINKMFEIPIQYEKNSSDYVLLRNYKLPDIFNVKKYDFNGNYICPPDMKVRTYFLINKLIR